MRNNTPSRANIDIQDIDTYARGLSIRKYNGEYSFGGLIGSRICVNYIRPVYVE